MNSVHFVVPAGVDDPTRPSGGNTYDRRVSDELTAAGWQVHEHLVAGDWPRPDRAALIELDRTLGAVPDGEVVLVDGLIGCAAAEVLPVAAARLRLVLLVHLPLGGAAGGAARGEAAVVEVAPVVITTSAWTRDRLRELYALPAGRLYVAHPGADPAGIVRGTADGTELLCVAAVAPHKGHDVLVEALAAIAGLHWRCRLIGALDRDPAFVELLHDRLTALGLADRFEFAGPQTGADLDRCYARADLLVSASLGETYGMALAEALARGLPVVTTDVGGAREALGSEPEGLPGLLVPPADATALAAALRRWLTEPELRAQLRATAAARRGTLPSWRASAEAVAAALVAAAAAR